MRPRARLVFGIDPHPEERTQCASRRMRPGRSKLPSFETAHVAKFTQATPAMAPPQDEVGDSMFDSLSERLGSILDRLTRRGALSESDVDAALREVRRALLEADVALDVVRAFTRR